MTAPTNPSPCPRCGAPVTGEFKFCPTCACRLQSSADWEPEPPRSRSWAHAILILFLGSLFAAILVFGYRIFGESPARPPPTGGTRPELTGPLTVSSLKDRLVHLYGGTSTYWRAPDGSGDDWPVQVGNCLFGEVEISRGEWLEFVRACEADATQVPVWLQELWRPDVAARVEDDAEPQRLARAFANQYIDAWWERVQAYHAEAHGEKVERPRDFVAPLPESYGVLPLVPPTWVRIGMFEDFTWALPENTARLPVTEISWYDAVAFAGWASNVLGISLRLPTAMEWIRAGNGSDPDRRYPWGNPDPRIGRLPRFACNSTTFWAGETPELLRVDYLFADGGDTPEGVQQMSGNAREWLHNHELAPRNGYYETRVSETIDVEVPNKDDPTKMDIVKKVVDIAPTLGGSFRDAVQDCSVDMSSLQVLSKFGRWNDVGFRLWAPSSWMGG